MNELEIAVERHTEQIFLLEKQIEDLKEVRSEIKSINITLMKLTTELKYTNQHLEKQELKIEDIDKHPRDRLNQLTTAIVSAVAGCIISILFGNLI